MSARLDAPAYSRTTLISACRTYRYSLGRSWDYGDGRVLFVMLNPSTADGSDDDPTVRRCVRFAQRWGYRELSVVNLFAYRATDPKDLYRAYQAKGADAVIGPENYDSVLMEVRGARQVVVAWGGQRAQYAQEKLGMLFGLRELVSARQLWCLGLTKGGEPRHPLMVYGGTPLEHFKGYPQ